MRIGLDAMGGDKAPHAQVEGAVRAVAEYGYHVTLIGDEERIRPELEKHEYPSESLGLVHTSQEIYMHDAAALSVRKKRDSSIVRGVELLKEGRYDAFVSAGNTGAVVCAATLSLRLLPGVDRPGIAIIAPTLGEPCMIIDVGANIDPKPLHLMQYGIMGDAYSKHILGKNDPSIGILNIGEESSKGTESIKEAHILLSESELNFIGNVEPKDVYRGRADVVVCDGFVGNVFLKVTEALATAAGELLRRRLRQSSIFTKVGALFMLPTLRSLKKDIDASEYGGAPLLGIDGSVIIAHGSSNAKAVKNAIRAAGEHISYKVNMHVVEELEMF